MLSSESPARWAGHEITELFPKTHFIVPLIVIFRGQLGKILYQSKEQS